MCVLHIRSFLVTVCGGGFRAERLDVLQLVFMSGVFCVAALNPHTAHMDVFFLLPFSSLVKKMHITYMIKSKNQICTS